MLNCQIMAVIINNNDKKRLDFSRLNWNSWNSFQIMALEILLFSNTIYKMPGHAHTVFRCRQQEEDFFVGRINKQQGDGQGYHHHTLWSIHVKLQPSAGFYSQGGVNQLEDRRGRHFKSYAVHLSSILFLHIFHHCLLLMLFRGRAHVDLEF